MFVWVLNQWIRPCMRPTHAGEVFIFKTLQGPEKWIFISENLQVLSFYLKEQLPTRKFENKFFIAILLGPQDGQIGFWPGQRKN